MNDVLMEDLVMKLNVEASRMLEGNECEVSRGELVAVAVRRAWSIHFNIRVVTVSVRVTGIDLATFAGLARQQDST
jgi:hypothetical protein